MGLDLDAVRRVLARYPVTAAYLFGSHASGMTTPLSDVDVAVLLEADAAAPASLQAILTSDLMQALHRSDVDVVILNAAPPLLKERVISRGRVLYCRDEIARVRFEVAARREYFDTQGLRAVQDRALVDRYANGR